MDNEKDKINKEEIKSEQITFIEASNGVVNENENEDVPKRNKGNKIPIIVISSIVSVIIIFIVIVCVVVANNPKLKVAKALKATNDEMNKRVTFVEKMTEMDDVTELYLKSNKEDIGMSIKSANIPDLEKMNGAGVNASFITDNQNKKYMLDLNGQYKGTSIANMKAYCDNKKFMITIPALYDSWLTCDAEHVQDQYNKSILGDYSQIPNEEISFKLFDDQAYRTVGMKKLNEEFIKVYLENNKSKLSDINKNIKAEKSKNTKEILVGGNSEKCKGYTVSIPSSDVNSFMESVYNYVLTDKQGQIVMDEYYRIIGYEDIINSSNKMSAYGDGWKGLINYLKSNLTFEDVNMNVYIDSKGRAAGIDIDTKYSFESKKFSVNLSSEYKGKENIGDDIDVSILSNDGKKDVNLDMNYDNVNEGSNTHDTLLLKMSNAGEVSTFSGDTKYNTESKALEGLFSIKSKEEFINLDYKGSYDFDKTNKKVKFDFEDINVQSNIDGKGMNMNCDFSYSIEPYDGTIEEPSGEKVEFFKLSQDKMVNIVLEMQKNAEKLGNTFR